MHVEKRQSPRSSTRSSARTPAMLLLATGLAGTVGLLAVTRGSAGSSAAKRGVAASKPASASEASTPLTVRVAPVAARRFTPPIRVTGTLKSEEVVTLSTKATGLVREVLAREGSRVRRGQLLVRIDDGELVAQRDRAVASVRSAEARLEQARTSRGIKNAAAEAEFREAEQALAAAKTRLSQTRSLAQIAATEVEAGANSARAQLQAARERLKALLEGSRRQEKARADLDVIRAQSAVSKLKANLERREQLLRDGAIAREDVENVRRDYEAALAELSSAREQADLVSEGPRSEDVRVAEQEVRRAEAALQNAEANRARRRITHEDVDMAAAEVRKAEARLASARAGLAQRQWNVDEIQSARADLARARADARYFTEQIAQTRVYSPFDGVVSLRKIHVGESVSATQNELMTLVATNELYFEATAPENALPYLREGQPAAVTLDARPGETFAGVVRRIIPVAQGANRSVRLRISMPQSEGLDAVIGGFARATLRGESRRAGLAVPRAAVVSDEGEKGVYLLAGGHARWHPIRAGITDGDRVEILSGLRPGDPVIVTDAATLTDGQRVAVKGQDQDR